mmetsp:Transcript_18276/g.39346  ORF Transcript_18276/g.39346 Transcript_18276/m.39346 type:complete len:229 (+) Transcript_18276:112-798(+)
MWSTSCCPRSPRCRRLLQVPRRSAARLTMSWWTYAAISVCTAVSAPTWGREWCAASQTRPVSTSVWTARSRPSHTTACLAQTAAKQRYLAVWRSWCRARWMGTTSASSVMGRLGPARRTPCRAQTQRRGAALCHEPWRRSWRLLPSLPRTTGSTLWRRRALRSTTTSSGTCWVAALPATSTTRMPSSTTQTAVTQWWRASARSRCVTRAAPLTSSGVQLLPAPVRPPP